MCSFVHRTRLWRTLAVVAVGLVASLAGWWVSSAADFRAVHRDLDNRARLDAEILEARFSDLESPVTATADLVAADADVTPNQFDRFADYVAPARPLMLWLGWAPMVQAADRTRFEADTRRIEPHFRIRDRTADGSLVPAAPRAEYLPLVAIRRFHAGGLPLGLDLAANFAQGAAARQAREKGRAIATVPMPHLNPAMPGKTVVMLAPVYYRHGAAPTVDAQARRRHIVGYVVAGYEINSVLDYVTAGVKHPNERISFARQLPVAGFGQASGNGAVAAIGQPLPPPAPGEYRVTRRLMFSEQAWTATFAFGPRALAELRFYAPFGWLGAGLLLTAALGTVTARSESQQRATEHLVETRTRELSAANERLRQSAGMLEATLEATPLGIIALDQQARISLWNRGAERIFGHQAADVLGKPYADLLVPPPHRDASMALDARIAAGEPVRDVEVQRQRSDGSLVDIRLAGNPLRDAAGQLHGIV